MMPFESISATSLSSITEIRFPGTWTTRPLLDRRLYFPEYLDLQGQEFVNHN